MQQVLIGRHKAACINGCKGSGVAFSFQKMKRINDKEEALILFSFFFLRLCAY
jgi:hypothetical protein